MFIVLVLLVAGTGLLLMGYDKLHTAVPTCFGKPMSPGDVCHARPVEVTEGMPKPQDSTYAEQLDSLTSGGWTAIGIGAAVLVLAVVLAVAFTTSAIQERRDL